MTTLKQAAGCTDPSQTARQAVASHVKKAVWIATKGQMQCLSVEPNGITFVLKGSCNKFYLRKDAIDAAMQQICTAVDKNQIPSASLTDLIEVNKPLTYEQM